MPEQLLFKNNSCLIGVKIFDKGGNILKVELSAEKLAESWRLMQPGHAVLLTTENNDGTFNLAPFTWVKPTSHFPPMVSVSLVNKPKKQHSLENIIRTKEFVINVTGMEMARDLVMCSQKVPEGMSKLELSRLKTSPAKLVKPPLLRDARANLECRASSFTETGDHYLIVAEIIAATYSEKAYTENLSLRLEASQPCLHLQQYNRAESQVHVFIESNSARVVEAPYLVLMPELQKGKDTF